MPKRSITCRITVGLAADHPVRRQKRRLAKSGWFISIRKMVSLPPITVQRSRSSTASASPGSNTGTVTMVARACNAFSSASVVPATW